MANLIALIIFFISLTGILIIIFRKISVLAELLPQEIENPGIFKKVKNKIRINEFTKAFSSKEILLQKILSKFKILTLKTENKTSNWLTKLRQRSLKKKDKKEFTGNYWKKLKKKLPK